MAKLKYKYIAIDFDGTIAKEDNFPVIGKILPGAKSVINKIIEDGGQVSIWTCRSGVDLHNAIEWLKENNINYTYINQDFPDIANNYEGFTRKICADVYIDNKEIHCLMGGGIVWMDILKFLYEE